MNNFDNHTFENTQPIFTNMNTTVRVVDIYDGDTCTVVIKLHDEYFKHSVRLCGIDTCEMKSKDDVNKMNAVKARNRLYELVTKTQLQQESSKKSGYTRNEIRKLLNANVYLCYLKIKSLDKYGRFLANMYNDEKSVESFSDTMLKEKLAYSYDGGTKQVGEILL
jgi:endonuclease YncB( thermonuclease family)